MCLTDKTYQNVVTRQKHEQHVIDLFCQCEFRSIFFQTKIIESMTSIEVSDKFELIVIFLGGNFKSE